MASAGSGDRTDQQLDRLRREYGEFDVVDEETVVSRAMYTDCLQAAEGESLGGSRVFVRSDDDAALVRYGDQPAVWDLPGGPTDHGESFAATARRHVRTDVGLDCELVGVSHVVRQTFTLVERGDGVGGLWVFFDAEADGDLAPGDGVAETSWFGPDEPPEQIDPHVESGFDGGPAD